MPLTLMDYARSRKSARVENTLVTPKEVLYLHVVITGLLHCIAALTLLVVAMETKVYQPWKFVVAC